MARQVFTSLSGSVRRLLMAPVLVGLIAAPAPRADAGPRWMLIYYRQFGNQLNANNRTIENHTFHEDGTKAYNVGITNQYNSGFAVFGYTDGDGWNRINPLDPNNCTYDITIYDPSTPKDQTPAFYWQNTQQSWPQFYSYITWWMRVSDDSLVDVYPQTPVYHYDLVDGVNQASGFNEDCQPSSWTEAPGANTDHSEYTPDGGASYQAQTFVVPQGINRIVGASAFLIRGGGPFTFRAAIRQNSPTGPQVGPATVSRPKHDPEFKEVAVCWGLDDVPVTPGQTYALYLDAPDGQGFNTFKTIADNYPDGHLYHGTTPVPDQDLVAVVVGVGYDSTPPPPPTIERNPASFTRTAIKGQNLPNDIFTIANSGGGEMDYTINDDAGWLYVDPDSGSVATETDTIDIHYDSAALASGPYTATITIAAPGAANTPQEITVEVTIPKPADFDQDGDVDQEDFGRFQACYTGGGVPQTDPSCAAGRLDPDEDVDLDDFGTFQLCMSGANVPSDPTCADE